MSTYRIQSDHKITVCAALHRLYKDDIESEPIELDENLQLCQYNIEYALHQILQCLPESERFEVWKALQQEIVDQAYGMERTYAEAIASQFMAESKRTDDILPIPSQRLDTRELSSVRC